MDEESQEQPSVSVLASTIILQQRLRGAKKPETDFNPQHMPLSKKTPSMLFPALLFSNVYL